MKSILQHERECFVCKTTLDLHEHHVFDGTANRRLSEMYGLKVYLCARHHNMSNEGVHFNKKLELALKRFAQKRFEKLYSHEKFMSVFGKNYLP